MKAGKSFSFCHSCMSVAVVGALAMAVSVQGSPRAGERGKSDGKSGASRLVTGPSAHINDAIAAGGTAILALTPVQPTTIPATTYPGGPGVISGQTLTLQGPLPARVWLEASATAWNPTAVACLPLSATSLKTVQITVDATDVPSADGGGYAGSQADCAGGPAPGAGSLTPAVVPCTDFNQCRAGVSGVGGGGCFAGEPSDCGLDVPGQCQNGFQNLCDPQWIASGLSNTSAADVSSINYRYGSTTNPGLCLKEFNPSYVGTLVLDVPATAKGTYTIDLVEGQSFLENHNPAGSNRMPILRWDAGIIKIGCGSCCTNLGPSTSVCTDGLSASQCTGLPNQPSVFRPDVACLDSNGDPNPCPSCTSPLQCNDGDACTTDTCVTFVCHNDPRLTWDQVNECCDAATGTETPLGCADQCQEASCSAGTNRGTAICTDTPGEECDDDNPCTYDDTCAGGVDSCAGIDANTVSCASSQDCATETGVGYPCIDLHCECTLTPDLDIIIVDLGEDNCFDEDEKITAEIVIGASSSPINGGQFLIGFDTSCLEYVDAAGVDPYTNAVDGPRLIESGVLFIAVGVEFGVGDGDNGGTMVSLSFRKKGNCNECQICPLNNNPYNTYLTDNEGQRITVEPNCSKEIYGDSTLTLTVPGNIKTNADCDRPTAVESWTAPSAVASCGDATQVVCRGEHEGGMVYSQAVVNGGGELLMGKSSFCCYATSSGPCPHTVGCPPNTDCADGSDLDTKPDGCWTVTVNDQTSLDITIGLSPGSQSVPGATLTRCIKFSVYSNCDVDPLVFDDDVTFGGVYEYVGKSTGKIKIPGAAQFDCITAQDQLHTLRSCYTFAANDCDGGQLNASFAGDPRLGGNWLIGGNLDGWKKDVPNSNPSLDVIDILDFGTFVMEYLSCYGSPVPSGNTPCGTAGPNGDINGDGCTDLDDYTILSSHFLVSAKQCCCGPQPHTAGAVAITEISVAQLRADGYADLVSADLNGDGLLNLADMAAFDQGVRPAKKAPVKGGSRSTGSR